MPLAPAPKLTNTASASSEASGHWYERHADGTTTPLYPEGGVFGMRQARALMKEGRCALPSVTTIFKDLHKGYLHDVWMPQQCILAAWDNPHLRESPTWLNEVKAIAFQQTDDAAKYGTAVHKALEDWFSEGIVDQEYADIVKAVEKEFIEHEWETEHLELCVGNDKLGYAGMCDVIGCNTSNNFIIGDPLVVDFKTRKTKPGQTPGLYGTDAMQIAAYGVAHFGEVFLESGIGANIIISTTEPGRIYTRIHKDLTRHYRAFEGLCQYWRYSHNYEPVRL